MLELQSGVFSAPKSDTGHLIREVIDVVRSYVVMTAEQALAVALWILHTHAFGAAVTTPYLHITSPQKGSGKTRLLEVLELLVRQPMRASNISDAGLYAAIHTLRPTMLIDECDAIFADHSRQDLRAILNSGNRAGGTVTRASYDKGEHGVVRLDVFGPKALAGIGSIPDTIAHRSIEIALKRRLDSEKVQQFRHKQAGPILGVLADRLAEWASAYVEPLSEADPAIPEGIRDREADGWEPLFAIADLGGLTWGMDAREAAFLLRAHDFTDRDAVDLRLLSDIERVFRARQVSAIRTDVLLKELGGFDDGDYGHRFDTRLTRKSLAQALKPYGIRPIALNGVDRGHNGYDVSDLSDAWARYLPSWTPFSLDTLNVNVKRADVERVEAEGRSEEGTQIFDEPARARRAASSVPF